MSKRDVELEQRYREYKLSIKSAHSQEQKIRDEWVSATSTRLRELSGILRYYFITKKNLEEELCQERYKMLENVETSHNVLKKEKIDAERSLHVASIDLKHLKAQYEIKLGEYLKHAYQKVREVYIGTNTSSFREIGDNLIAHHDLVAPAFKEYASSLAREYEKKNDDLELLIKDLRFKRKSVKTQYKASEDELERIKASIDEKHAFARSNFHNSQTQEIKDSLDEYNSLLGRWNGGEGAICRNCNRLLHHRGMSEWYGCIHEGIDDHWHDTEYAGYWRCSKS